MSIGPINGIGPTQGQRNTLTSKSLLGSKSLLLFSLCPRITVAGTNLGETAAFGCSGRGFTSVKVRIESTCEEANSQVVSSGTVAGHS